MWRDKNWWKANLKNQRIQKPRKVAEKYLKMGHVTEDVNGNSCATKEMFAHNTVWRLNTTSP